MNALIRTINIVGGQTELASRINQWMVSKGCHDRVVKQQHVWKWVNHSSGIPTVPPAYRVAIEEITDGAVTARDLSHDIYLWR